LAAALTATYNQNKLDAAAAATLNVNTAQGSRAHPIRDDLMVLAFGAPAARSAAGLALAVRLGISLDNRSKATLLIASVHRTSIPAHKQVILWTFPQQEVFQFGSGTSIQVVDAFIRQSSLRKAAAFAGSNTRVDFLDCRVLDMQSDSADRAVADLWTVKFLDARLQMGSAEGTRLLAAALRRAHNRHTDDPAAQEQIHAAILSIRHSNAARVSLGRVSDMLDGDVRHSFVGPASNQAERTTQFRLDRELFDELVQFRIFQLDNGVWVSSPFNQIGDSVRIEGRHLVAMGTIEVERVRSRHA
jgi:hypothetical protein